MNYATLSALLQDTTENREAGFVANIPNFVKQAEQRVFNTVLFAALRKNVGGALTANNRYLTCPNDFLATSALAVVDGTGKYSYLTPKDPSFIREAYPDPTVTALPQYYGLYGPLSTSENSLVFLVGPTPDQNYTAELNYYYYPTSIVTAGNSWLGDHFDTVLLYGALVEAYIYMKGEQDVFTAYEMKFKEALAMAKRLGDGMERGDTNRNSEPRVATT